jgi:glucose/mannose transport system substrate-binding protein
VPIRRRHLLTWALAAPALGLSACGQSGDQPASQEDNQVEVFSWWAGPGEKEGFDALIAEFKRRYPDVEFINAVVAGGAGTNAKSVLAGRLKAGDPPDSYQAHAGLELASDIKAGWVLDLSYLYKQEGWTDKFPKGLVDAIAVEGKIYSVPVNIHRANLMWYSPKVLHDAGIGGPPTTWKEFLAQAGVLGAKHITALSIGPTWTQKHLLENVLLSELGADGYSGLWNGRTDWKSSPVAAALETFKKVLAVSDLASAAGDWQPAVDKVISGAVAYNIMGDWVDAYLARSRNLKYRTDYAVVTAPGTSGVYNFLSDSFTLPKGAPHRGSAEKWLIVCGSVDGQDAFNPQKGSVPARIDADRSKYHDYLAGAMTDWQDPHIRVVGSLTHGVVAGNAWNEQIDKALAQFVQDSDTARFVDTVVAGAPFR